MTIVTAEDLATMKPGDHVTICMHSDRKAAVVTKVTAKGIEVAEVEQHLLNGPNSGEPDALHCSVGGFAGHVSGKQRWHTGTKPVGKAVRYTARKFGHVCRSGSTPQQTGNRLLHGHRPHYDYNF